MTRRSRIAAWAMVIAIGCTGISGCVITPAQPYSTEYVTVAPPPPRVEVIGIPPYPGYFWVGGYWAWTGHRHRWVPGYWQAPRDGYRWVPHHWEHREHGWSPHEGYWRRH